MKYILIKREGILIGLSTNQNHLKNLLAKNTDIITKKIQK